MSGFIGPVQPLESVDLRGCRGTIDLGGDNDASSDEAGGTLFQLRTSSMSTNENGFETYLLEAGPNAPCAPLKIMKRVHLIPFQVISN